MSEPGASLVTIVAIGAAVGGFVQGLAGFAFGLISLGIRAWAVEPAIAGPLVVFGSLIGQLLSFGTVRNSLDARVVLPFVIGGVLGIPVGIMLLHRIDPATFKLFVGLILLLWCPTMLVSRRLPHLTFGGQLADSVAGWVGGVMGGLGGLTGPAPTLWCALRGWGRDKQRAVFQTFNLTMQTITMVAYVATGAIGGEAAWLCAVVVPAMLVPTLIGARLYRRFTDIGFQRLVLLLLTLSGAVLVGSSLARFVR